MTDQTDFVGLYRELDITPDCSLEEFRMAYRRRVSELHPDRSNDGGERLAALNLRYSAAMEFFKAHGRLPGAAPTGAAVQRPARTGGTRQATPAGYGRRDDPPRNGPSRLKILLVLILVALAIWLGLRGLDDVRDLRDLRAPGEHSTPERPRASSGSATIGKGSITGVALGMSPTSVTAMVGQPVDTENDGQRWLYGPSWIQFDCDQVIDWYSSPVKPLRATSTRPPDAGDDKVAARPRQHCPPGRTAQPSPRSST